jgi:hypothetical protein
VAKETVSKAFKAMNYRDALNQTYSSSGKEKSVGSSSSRAEAARTAERGIAMAKRAIKRRAKFEDQGAVEVTYKWR